ncbi:hypothetical protein [Alicyclobacillus macrosporangiidus]|uniref:hypothetical protein n=1 Tax=Alicyclobacillus macrosporangiidus TaxID=392015 RepID=UPI000496D83A|nr:hypothetical protein [Alicyclobacillus macrosporangiidus]
MILDDELREHLAEGLLHLDFLRQFLRRTGFTEEIDNLGWPYGMDMNGPGDQIYDAQLEIMLRLLAPGLTSQVIFTSGDDEMWAHCHWLEGDVPDEEVVYDIGCVIIIKGQDPQQVAEWRHWIWWMAQRKLQSFIGVHDTIEEPHFVWVLPEAITDEIMAAWDVILSAWEVKQFYEHRKLPHER